MRVPYYPECSLRSGRVQGDRANGSIDDGVERGGGKPTVFLQASQKVFVYPNCLTDVDTWSDGFF